VVQDRPYGVEGPFGQNDALILAIADMAHEHRE
jgi:hypothetical protein